MTESYTYIKNSRLIHCRESSSAFADILIKNKSGEAPAKIVATGNVQLPGNA